LLDPVRCFIPKENVLRIIDCMAMLKINKLHFHLTDDKDVKLSACKNTGNGESRMRMIKIYFFMMYVHWIYSLSRSKLIHFYNDINWWELYDLQADPSEMHNLYGQPEYDRT